MGRIAVTHSTGDDVEKFAPLAALGAGAGMAALGWAGRKLLGGGAKR